MYEAEWYKRKEKTNKKRLTKAYNNNYRLYCGVFNEFGGR